MTKRTPTEPQLTRAEKLRKRGLPVTIVLGSLALVGAGLLVGQTVANNANHDKAVAASDKISKEHADFLALLDKTATKQADSSEVVPDSAIVNPGNHLYDDALAFAEAHNLTHEENGVDTLLETAVAISKANYIQPDSTFVLSETDPNHDGVDELVVQLAPKDLGTK
ncbi:MAG: hypothetical protein JWN26_435 [Candidatus Saccharibacteria bacterium]|nr:hypothetical protein [Candidatus Saccharibacteria bacterium]